MERLIDFTTTIPSWRAFTFTIFQQHRFLSQLNNFHFWSGIFFFLIQIVIHFFSYNFCFKDSFFFKVLKGGEWARGLRPSVV